MARIYTKTGDDGTTGLIGGHRVPKDSVRIEAYGCIDELNAVLGAACALPMPDRARAAVHRVQDDLFTLGANLALPPGEKQDDWGISPIREEDTRALEREIDACEALLEPLRRFILPGGSPSGAMLHLARTVARRAERRCVALGRMEPVDAEIVRYLNRLSDLCFVLARWVNRESAQGESHPTFGKRGDTPAG
jgi:cob(I)alamin adenosyltransferase